MKNLFAVDRIEEDTIFLESIITGDKREIDRKKYPCFQEGDILYICNGIFIKDEKTTELRKEMIRSKLERLKGKE